jgi:anti-sigma-K factor RskA
MSSADKHQFDEQLLTRYLLGAVSGEEAERLDESSVADSEFALHLDGVENDLVDSYVVGALSGETLERFEKFYLSSPRRREKVEFARALLRFEERAATAAAPVSTAPAVSDARLQDQAPQHRSPGRWFTVPRIGLQWVFAAAALAMLLASSYLFVENERLRKQGDDARSQQTALDLRARELERELSEQRSANAGMLRELESLRASLPEPRVLKTIAVLLLASTRGVGQVPTVAVPSGTDQVRFQLQLEPSDFRTYQVALKDPVTGQTLWEAAKLLAGSRGQSKIVSVSVPAHLLKQQNYTLELTGVPAQGNPELVTSYVFKVVLE